MCKILSLNGIDNNKFDGKKFAVFLVSVLRPIFQRNCCFNTSKYHLWNIFLTSEKCLQKKISKAIKCFML